MFSRIALFAARIAGGVIGAASWNAWQHYMNTLESEQMISRSKALCSYSETETSAKSAVKTLPEELEQDPTG